MTLGKSDCCAGAALRVQTTQLKEATRSELGHPVLAKPFTAAALWQAISDVMSAGSP
jgi:hypothetical protein